MAHNKFADEFSPLLTGLRSSTIREFSVTGMPASGAVVELCLTIE